MIKRKIAFFHYPHNPNVSRLETMPFSLNAVFFLAKMGWNVDLYLWEEPSLNYQNLLPEQVNIKFLKNPKLNPNSRLIELRAKLLISKFKWQNNYYCVFGLGPLGSYIGSLIAKLNRCPFIHFNDEFPSNWDWCSPNFYTSLLQQAVQNAAIVVIPDPNRFHPLCQELDIRTKPYAVLPNLPMITYPLIEEINWYEKLGIPRDFIPFLNAGSIDESKQIPEILASLPYWHEKAVLILHSLAGKKVETYRQQLSHLEVPGKVFWNFEILSESYLNSLVSFCKGNFALYRDIGPNVKYTGFSSGKLMRSLACGSPVIASKGFSFSFVEDYHLGVLVNHPSEIPDAVNKIIYDRESYSKRCLDFCQHQLFFETTWQNFCDKLKQIANIDLYQVV